MALFLRVHPHGQQYRLPKQDEAGDVTRSIAEILGKRGCVVIGYEVPEPRADAVVLINGNVIESIELVDVPERESEG
jgi:hypothetical protein